MVIARRSIARLAAHLGALAIMAGQMVVVAAILSHRSMLPVVLGRYSARYALFALFAVTIAAATGALVVLSWRRLPTAATKLADWCERHTATTSTACGAGILAVAGGALLHDLIALLMPASLLLAGAVSLALGGALFVGGSMPVGARSTVGAGALLMVVGVSAAFGIGELALRAAPDSAYRVMREHVSYTFEPIAGVMPGVHGPSVFSTREFGIRGDPYPVEGSHYNLLAIGGSTTECVYLDDSEAWPFLLQQRLNEAGLQPAAWVGNVGRSGHSVVENILVLRHFVPQIDVDAVIVIAGINDMMSILQRPEGYDPARHTPDATVRYLHRTFAQRPLRDAALGRPFPQDLALFSLFEIAYWRAVGATIVPGRIGVEDRAGASYVARRRAYQVAEEQLDEPPDLGPALARYEQNLRILAGEARRQGLRLVMATQPAIYHDDLSAEAERLLWFGQLAGRRGRYSVAAMRSALQRFNARLLDTCREMDIECVDLAAQVGGSEAFFYDDVHFSEAGAAAVADVLAQALARSARVRSDADRPVR